jgi:hypothetical protein
MLLEALGRQMGIEVVANVSRAQTLTLAFDRLVLEDALELLRAYANIVYVKESAQAEAKIRRIIAIPRQAEVQRGERVLSVREDITTGESQ